MYYMDLCNPKYVGLPIDPGEFTLMQICKKTRFEWAYGLGGGEKYGHSTPEFPYCCISVVMV